MNVKSFVGGIRLRAHFALSGSKPTILEALEKSKITFNPRNTEASIETFEKAVKEDTKTHKMTLKTWYPPQKKQLQTRIENSTREDLIITQADKTEETVFSGIDKYLKKSNSYQNRMKNLSRTSTRPLQRSRHYYKFI